MPVMKEIQFAGNLKRLRKQTGLTRKALADRIGYTDKAIEKWEAGQSQPPLAVLCRLAEEFGVGLEELVYERRVGIRYFLGIDGGGTKTKFRLENVPGEVLAECELGPSNPNDVGLERCAEILKAGIMETAAGIDRGEIAVFAGIAGSLSEENRVGIRRVLDRMGFGFADNGSDNENILELYLRGGDGVTVIVGTGSIAFAQKNGVRRRVGGWGYLLDSGGSGYNLGRDALEAAYRALDGRGPETALTRLLEDRLGKTVEAAIPELYGGGKKMIASLAPLVFEACDAGDRPAEEILRKNAAHIAELIRTAAAFVGDPDAPVVLCGGLTQRADLLEKYIMENLDEGCRIRFGSEPLVKGAVLCARRKYAQYGKTE